MSPSMVGYYFRAVELHDPYYYFFGGAIKKKPCDVTAGDAEPIAEISPSLSPSPTEHVLTEQTSWIINVGLGSRLYRNKAATSRILKRNNSNGEDFLTGPHSSLFAACVKKGSQIIENGLAGTEALQNRYHGLETLWSRIIMHNSVVYCRAAPTSSTSAQSSQ